MCEHSMVAAKASVMVYNDVDKKWIPGGSSPGISKVNIYHHSVNNTFRVVGRKLQDMEVVVNCSIFKGLKYNQATPTFHQWRDNRQVYGLNFVNKEEADSFAQAMYTALETLSLAIHPPPPPPSSVTAAPHSPQPQQQTGSLTMPASSSGHPLLRQVFLETAAGGTGQQTQAASQNGMKEAADDQFRGSRPPSSHDIGRTHQRHSSADFSRIPTISDPPSSSKLDQHQPGSGDQSPKPISSQQGLDLLQNAPTKEEGFGCDSSSLQLKSVPLAPALPPTPPVPQSKAPVPLPIQSSSVTPPPAPPPAPPLQAIPPPPPPPPGPSPSVSDATVGGKQPPAPPPTPPMVNSSSLAVALKSAHLRRVPKPDSKDREEGLVNYTGSSGTSVRLSGSTVPGTENIMSEMARRLKERRAKAEGGTADTDEQNVSGCNSDGKKSSITGTAIQPGNGSRLAVAAAAAAANVNCTDSPRTERSRRFQSLTGQEMFHTIGPNVGANRSITFFELEGIKNELLAEMRKEIQSAKQEIIEAVRLECNRR